MYIRFVVYDKDKDSGKRLGLFHASKYLRESKQLSEFEEIQLLSIMNWFNKNLEKLEAFTRSSKPHAKGVAISWFKDTAREHLAKMYEFSSILDSHGIAVEVIKSHNPGYIVYEDKFQVTAQPYAQTKT